MIDVPNVTGMLHICCKCTMCIHRWLTGDPSATSPAFQAPAFQVGIDRPFIVLLTSSWRQQVVISWWGRPVPAYMLHACDATINQMMARQMPIITINKMRGNKQWWSVTRHLINNNKLQYAGKWVHPQSKKRLLAHTKPFQTLFDISRYKQLYWQQQRIFQQYKQWKVKV